MAPFLIFNSKGEVIGIATASIVTGQNLNFAIPVSKLEELILGKSINRALSQINFPLLSKGKRRLSDVKSKELIRVIDYSHGTQYVGGSGIFEFSIYNGSLNDISNTKVVVLFYKGIWNSTKRRYVLRKGEYPIHFEAYQIKDLIPSRLSKRVTRIVDVIYPSWVADFRVLDYNILASSGDLKFK